MKEDPVFVINWKRLKAVTVAVAIDAWHLMVGAFQITLLAVVSGGIVIGLVWLVVKFLALVKS